MDRIVHAEDVFLVLRRGSNVYVRKHPEYSRTVLPNKDQNHPCLGLHEDQGPASLKSMHVCTLAHVGVRPHPKLSRAEDFSLPQHSHKQSPAGKMALAEVPGGRPSCLSNDGWNYLQKALQ